MTISLKFIWIWIAAKPYAGCGKYWGFNLANIVAFHIRSPWELSIDLGNLYYMSGSGWQLRQS